MIVQQSVVYTLLIPMGIEREHSKILCSHDWCRIPFTVDSDIHGKEPAELCSILIKCYVYLGWRLEASHNRISVVGSCNRAYFSPNLLFEVLTEWKLILAVSKNSKCKCVRSKSFRVSYLGDLDCYWITLNPITEASKHTYQEKQKLLSPVIIRTLVVLWSKIVDTSVATHLRRK